MTAALLALVLAIFHGQPITVPMVEAAGGTVTTEERERCHDLVVVPGARHCLNVATAGTVVMYDRWARGVRL